MLKDLTMMKSKKNKQFMILALPQREPLFQCKIEEIKGSGRVPDIREQKVKLNLLPFVEPFPVMKGWSSIQKNIAVDDEDVLTNIPYLSYEADTKEENELMKKLHEYYDDKVHGMISNGESYMNDEIFLELVKALWSKYQSSPEPDLTLFEHLSDYYPDKGDPKQLKAWYEALIGKSPIKCPPNVDMHQPPAASSDAAATLSTREQPLNSFHSLFCKRCFIYDCKSNHNYEYKEPPSTSTSSMSTTPRKNQTSKTKQQKKPCSTGCFMNEQSKQTSLVDGQQKSKWNQSEVAIYKVYNQIEGFKFNSCVLSKFIRTKQCFEIREYIKSDSAFSPNFENSFLVQEQTDCQDSPNNNLDSNKLSDQTNRDSLNAEAASNSNKTKKKQIKKAEPKQMTKVQAHYSAVQFRLAVLKETNSGTENKESHKAGRKRKSNKQTESISLDETESHIKTLEVNKRAYKPCHHPNKPCDKNCPCVLSHNFCEKYCFCAPECENRFLGCDCKKGGCNSRHCACFLAKRECDPESCCCSAAAVINSGPMSPKAKLQSSCDNINLQCGRKKHLLLAPSETAGWGIFIKDRVSKGEFIAEYCGEMISNEEAEKRGLVYDFFDQSYLFQLNEDVSVDAKRKGNKVRFANHSTDPNCIVRICLVNGDHRIGIFANRDIEKGEELFFNYGEKFIGHGLKGEIKFKSNSKR